MSGRRALWSLVALAGTVCPAGAETYTFTLEGTETCTVSVAPPNKPLVCRVWKRMDLGRFGSASLSALEMIATDADGASRGELHVLPHPLAAVAARIDDAPGGASLLDAPGAGRVQSLRSCLGRWIEMDVRMPSGAVHRGWMPRSCANQLTTCG